MNRKRNLSYFVVFCWLLAAVATAHAGGWATIELEEMPATLEANKEFRLLFTVLQHGERPVHRLSDDWPIMPFLEATHVETETAVRFEAEPLKMEGAYLVDVTLPEAGEWTWRIVPDPLVGTTEFASLTVAPATVGSASPAEATMPSLSVALAGGVAGLLLLGTAVFLWGRRTSLSAGAA